jgi:hypothetical protein
LKPNDQAKNIDSSTRSTLIILMQPIEHHTTYLITGMLDTTDGQQLFIAGLYLRSLTVFQAMIILSERGIASEVKATFRSLYELRFKIKAIVIDPLIAKRLIFLGEQKIKMRLEALKKEKWLYEKNPNRANPEERLKAQDAALISIERDILSERPSLEDKKGRLRRLDIKEVATIAGMKTDYDVVYSYLCEATHSSAQYLEEMVTLNEQGHFTGFKYPERDERLLTFCLSGTALHLDNLETTAEILKKDKPSEMSELRGKNLELQKKLRIQ